MNQAVEFLEPQPSSLQVKLAESVDEIEQTFRLRYQVFVEEAKNLHLYNQTGLELDEYDSYCDHLIVKDLGTGMVCGTYRLLPGQRALRNIGFYSETEFDLASFRAYRRHVLELGRSCVAPGYRGRRVIQLLWEGIADYLKQNRYAYLIGCASLCEKSQREINEIYSLLHRKGAVNELYGIKPRETHRVEGLRLIDDQLDEKAVFRQLPPLMKGYQWLGAEIGGEPAYDKLFNSTDFFVILETDKVSERYQRRFLDYKTAVKSEIYQRQVL